MVATYRCSNCGYFHVGPAPETCPVCGASRSAFKAYEGPGDLTGTKTVENLKAAFAGESQAAEKYLVFAEKAAAEGLPNVANLFRAIEGLHERLMPLFKKNSA